MTSRSSHLTCGYYEDLGLRRVVLFLSRSTDVRVRDLTLTTDCYINTLSYLGFNPRGMGGGATQSGKGYQLRSDLLRIDNC